MKPSLGTILTVASVSLLTLSPGCNLLSGGASPRVVPVAGPHERAALLEQVQKLDGEWLMTDEKGQTVVACVFKTTSGGSAVREVMFPGAPHEMTNMYHMDGRDLVVTHYCAHGNQPRMRAKPGKPGAIEFKLDSVANLTDAGGQYMGELTLTLVDTDALQEEWRSFQDGKAVGQVRFDLRRKK